MTFINSAKAATPPDYYDNGYGYDHPSPYLFNFSRLLQIVVSQAGTFFFTKKFHDSECGIFKSEGGCNMPGVGELVLGHQACYFEYAREDKTKAKSMADMITKIVLEWQPEDPIQSMMLSASAFCGCTPEDLTDCVGSTRGGGVFSGDALSNFFDWNPFSEAPIQEEYEKWVWANIYKQPEKEIEERQADRALGKQLLKEMGDMLREIYPKGEYYSGPMSCSPRRTKDSKLLFWINTGRQTQIDGWKTEEDIRAFIAGRSKLVDTAKY